MKLLSSKTKDNSSPFDGLIGAGKIALDVISAPSRAVGGIIAEGNKDGFDALDLGRGLTHAFDSKYDPSDVLKEKDFVKGLALDIALDPLTYASLGLGGAIKGGLTAGAKGIERAAATKGFEAATEGAAKATEKAASKSAKAIADLRKSPEIKTLEADLGKELPESYLEKIHTLTKQSAKTRAKVANTTKAKKAAKYEEKANKLDNDIKKLYSPELASDAIKREKDIARAQKAVKRVNDKPDKVQLKLMLKPAGFNLPGNLSEKIAIPLSPVFSRSATAAKLTETFPRVAAAAATTKNVFKAGGNLDPRVSEAERINSNLAEYDVSARINELGDQVKNIKKEEMFGPVAKVIQDSQSANFDLAKLADDTTRAAAKNSSDSAIKEIANTYESLSDHAKTFIQDTRQRFITAGKEDLASGRISGKIEGYWPTLQAAKKTDGIDSLHSRNTYSQFLTEQGFQKKRAGKKVQNFNPLEAVALWELQRANAIGTENMLVALSRETGRQFIGKRAEEAAAAAGFARPTSSVAKRILGEDQYLPAQIAQSIDRLNEVYATPKALAGFTRGLQKFTAMFKNSAYTVNPGHLTVDAIGDTWNCWLANIPIFDPRYSVEANRVATKLFKAVTSENPADRNAIVKIVDDEYTFEELERALAAEGLRNTGRSVGSSGKMEELGLEFDRYMGNGPKYGGKLNPRKGLRAIVEGMQSVGNRRDNRARAVAMIAQLKKNLESGMAREDALAEAAITVRVATFDYNDLSNIEKRIFRNVIPFYTWTRKNIPYQLASLAKNPGRTTLPFKAQEQSFDASGAPERGIVPEYVRANQFLIPKQISSLIPFLGDKPLYWNPMLPSMDLGRFQTFRTQGNTTPFELQDVLGMLNPAIKAPFEVAQGREFYTGQPITNGLSYGLRAFGGQTGAQVVRQGDPYPGEQRLFNLPIGSTRRELLGLSSQFIGLRGYSLDPQTARVSANYRLQDIQARQAAKEQARKDAGVLFNLPIIGDVTNPFTYQ